MVNDVYENPYCEAGDFQSGGAGECYDYTQPVSGDYEPTDGGINRISDSSDAFYQGDYDTALKQADKAVKEMPKNPDMHQFRSLVLFAQKRYRESAMAAHPALVSGKGWNWETLRSFYPSKEIYTAQLRSLEKFTADNSKNAAGQFLLGYHYMMLGHADAAGKQLATVVKLEPKDKLAATMLAGISAQTGKTYGGSAAAKGNQPAGKTLAAMKKSKNGPVVKTPKTKTAVAGSNAVFNLVGNWTAASADGSTIDLTIGKDGKFRWTIKAGGQTFAINGTWTLKNGRLKLQSPKEKEPLEGTLTSNGNNAFQLAMKDAPKDEPALTFKRQ